MSKFRAQVAALLEYQTCDRRKYYVSNRIKIPTKMVIARQTIEIRRKPMSNTYRMPYFYGLRNVFNFNNIRIYKETKNMKFVGA